MLTSLPPRPLVLYAEDDPDDVLLIHHLFNDHPADIELVTVPDGLKALEFLETSERAPNLIILDVNMPRLNGRDALVRLRAMSRFIHTPVLLFTTSSMELHRAFAKKYGADFMTKPLRDYQLDAILRRFAPVGSERKA